MAKRKQTLVLDFDGVIHSYSSGWHGAEVVADGPVPGAVSFISRAVSAFDLAVFSQRSSSPSGIRAMQTAIFGWLADELGDPAAHKIMDQIKFPDSKPLGFLVIDDRALTFTGVFPTIEEVSAFQPWNKKNTSVYERDRSRFADLLEPMVTVRPGDVTDLQVDDLTGAVSYIGGLDYMAAAPDPLVWPGVFIAIDRPNRSRRLARVTDTEELPDGRCRVVAMIPARQGNEEV